MSYSKAEQLLQLASLVSSKHRGVTLEEISETFSVSHRTAQRMSRALEAQFPEIAASMDAEGRKRWRSPRASLADQIPVTAEELAALDLAAMALKRFGQEAESGALVELREKIIGLIPKSRSRLAPDHEALMEAQGFVARPGPKPRMDEGVYSRLTQAIKACRLVRLGYRSRRQETEAERIVEPLGFLSGVRRYLVAVHRSSERGAVIKTFRLDGVTQAEVTADYFERPQDFDLQTFANRAFGVFQRDEEIVDVVWKFSARAAQGAASFQFHPEQSEEVLPDGSFLVKFRSAGLLEMAWHLYAWGSDVEVVEPPALRELVEGHRRSDFVALP